MDYAVVQAVADQFRASAGTLRAVDSALEMAAALLRASALAGIVGDAALAQYLSTIQVHVRRLASTCEELHGDLIGAIHSLREGDYSGSQRFVDAGLPAAVGPAQPGGARRAAAPSGWSQYIINNRPAFRFAGTLADAVGFVPGTEPVLLPVGGALTFLSNYGEEPDLVRGGGIAALDTLVGYGIGRTPPGFLVQGGNTVVQLVGQTNVMLSNHWADTWNLSPELAGALHRGAGNYATALEHLDIGNIRYDAARLLWDLGAMQRGDAGALAQTFTDAGRLVNTTADFGCSLFWEMPNANFDLQFASQVGLAAHHVNQSGLPVGMRASLNRSAALMVDYVEHASLVEIATDLIPRSAIRL